MVSFDTNLNGLLDDEWYELAGSEYYKPETIKNYRITYDRPDPNKIPEPDMGQQWSDATYVPWKDNQGNTGYIAKNIYHTQSYYPKWIEENSLTFSGTRLRITLRTRVIRVNTTYSIRIHGDTWITIRTITRI